MRVSKEDIYFRTEPYLKEAGAHLGFDIFAWILVNGVCIWAQFPVLWILGLNAVYLLIDLLFVYRLIFKILKDRKEMETITETGTVIRFDQDHTGISRGSQENGYVSWFYPEETYGWVSKRRLTIIDSAGVKKKIRSFMSFSRQLDFKPVKDYFGQYQITYLKRSKILIGVSVPDVPIDELPNRIRKPLIKALKRINNSI